MATQDAGDTIRAVDRFLDFVLEVLDRARAMQAFASRREVLLDEAFTVIGGLKTFF